MNTKGLQTHQLYGVALSQSDQNTLLEGSQDNGVALTTDGGVTWTRGIVGDSGQVGFDGIIGYATDNGPGFYRSGDAGMSQPWVNRLPNDANGWPFIPVMAQNPLNASFIVLGSKGSVWETRTGGITTTSSPDWVQIGQNVDPGHSVTALAYGSPKVAAGQHSIYAAFDDGRMFRMDRNNADFVSGTWTELGHPWGGADRSVTAIVDQPDGSGTVYVTIGAFDGGGSSGQVFRSSDYGSTWTDITGNLPKIPTNTVVLDKSSTTGTFTPYVGNDDGVYVGVANGATYNWARFDQALPHVQVTNLQLHNYAGTRILAAATHGRGAWLTRTAGDPPPLPGVRVNDVRRAEGNLGLTDFTFTITLSTASSLPVSVDYATADGTATVADNDYQAAQDTLTFNPGETSKTITVEVVGDTIVEPDETFFVNLSNAVDAVIVQGSGKGTIINDDVPPGGGGGGGPGGSASVGDYTWNDMNDNGIQDAGESGLPNIVVNLLDGQGNWLAATNSDATGHYQFSGWPAGDYQLEFVAPSGYQFSPQGQGGDPTRDSDPDGSGLTTVFSLSAGQQRTDLDAGLYFANAGGGGPGGGDPGGGPGGGPGGTGSSPSQASVGDFVWNDTDDDGIQDSGEPGLGGVVVNLLDSQGNWLGSTTSDGGGHYEFSGLSAGNYRVRFVAPSGYQFSPQGQGGDSARDSDPDASGLTAIFSLSTGQTRTDIDAGLTSVFYPLTGSQNPSAGSFVTGSGGHSSMDVPGATDPQGRNTARDSALAGLLVGEWLGRGKSVSWQVPAGPPSRSPDVSSWRESAALKSHVGSWDGLLPVQNPGTTDGRRGGIDAFLAWLPDSSEQARVD